MSLEIGLKTLKTLLSFAVVAIIVVSSRCCHSAQL